MKIQTTKISNLILLAIFTATFGWSLTRLWPTWFDQDLQVPALAPVTIFILVTVLLGWALMMKARLNPDNKDVYVDPLVAARTAALAMAASRVGSLAVGMYSGIFLVNYFQRDHSVVSDRLWICALCVFGGFVMAVIAVWLEKMCQIKQPPASPQTPGITA